jgi:dienelactone hydrolase
MVTRRCDTILSWRLPLLRLAVVWLSVLGMASARPAACTAVATWHVEVPDPQRPGRQVTALLVGPTDPAVPCPVAVLGHATLTAVQHYLYLAEPLAAAGWLVALPTTEGGLPGDQGELAADMLLLARLLRDGSPDLPPDLPATAAGPVALLGHSLGGGAAVVAAAAAASGEIGTLAVLAPQERPRPSMIGQAPLVDCPALIVAGELDCVTPAQHQAPLWSALASEQKVLATLLGGGHCAFAGEAEPCHGSEQDGCPPLLTAAAQMTLTAELVIPWLDWQVRGDAQAAAAFVTAAGTAGIAVESLGLTAVGREPAAAGLRLLAGSPGRSTVQWQLDWPRQAIVTAEILDVRGRRVRTLTTGPGSVAADGLELRWNGRDEAGRPAPAGVYVLRVLVEGTALHARCVRLR